MKKYLVKEVSKATENNKNFKGQTQVYFMGKGDEIVAIYGTNTNDRLAWGSDIIEYGYSRKCDAARNWSYRNPENSEFWESTVEIVEIDMKHIHGLAASGSTRVDLLAM